MVTTEKINKTFPLSDSSVNCYGFRLLTSGYLKDEFNKNPIGYYMHDRDKGVIVKWDNLRIEGDNIVAEPVINLSNERGKQCVNEINDGFLKGASMGHIVALKWSDDPKDMIPGQTGPTVTEWYNRECSVVDIPGNLNCLALYDKDGNVINLADFGKGKQTINMKEIKLTAAQLAELFPNLKDASAEEVSTAFKNLKAEADKVPQLTQQLADATTAKKTVDDLLAAEKTKNVKDEVTRIVEKGLADKKLTVEMSNVLKAQYAERPVELKALVDTFKPFESVTNDIPTGNLSATDQKAISDLMAKTGDELFAIDGAWEKLKALDKTSYEKKYKEWTGKEVPKD